ncbi:MAG TPA: MarR family transcriptional regulator [Chthoniobacterales bacterium]|nr:MarR family transcriptional regulator [Chthoniobacterales bacterium]
MPSPAKIDDAENPVQRPGRCNAGAIKRAARRISLTYDKALAPTGLRITQYGILTAINSRGAALPTMHELAEDLVMDRSTLGQNLRPLVRDGLITILTDPRDRRSRLIGLTKRGFAKLNQAAGYWETAQDHFEVVVGEQAAADLRTLLIAIAHNPKLGERES